jgi:hypothetical protein
VAHNGICYDYVMLLKTEWRLADSLPIFKIIVRLNEDCKLSTLTNIYTPWFSHV